MGGDWGLLRWPRFCGLLTEGIYVTLPPNSGI